MRTRSFGSSLTRHRKSTSGQSLRTMLSKLWKKRPNNGVFRENRSTKSSKKIKILIETLSESIGNFCASRDTSRHYLITSMKETSRKWLKSKEPVASSSDPKSVWSSMWSLFSRKSTTMPRPVRTRLGRTSRTRMPRKVWKVWRLETSERIWCTMDLNNILILTFSCLCSKTWCCKFRCHHLMESRKPSKTSTSQTTRYSHTWPLTQKTQ